MIRRLFALFTAVSLLFALSACSETPVSMIYYPVYEDMTSCDPQIAATDVENLIVTNCFEGLVRVDAEGNIVPAAADSWTISPDGRTYTFNIRPNAQWYRTVTATEEMADILPTTFAPVVTADDFVFALQRALDPATGAPDAYMLYAIENARLINEGKLDPTVLGVKALNSNQLQITLSEPQSNFLFVLTESICMPCNRTFFEACGGRMGMSVKYMLSNGPFCLYYVSEDTFTLMNSPKYEGPHKAVPYRVFLYSNPNGEGIPQKITDDLYSAAYLTDSMFSAVTVDSSYTVTELENAMYSFVFNLNNEVLANDNIRKAIALSCDKQQLATNAGKEHAATLLPSICGFTPECSNLYDETLAQNCLQNGLKELEKDSVELTVLTSSEYEDLIRKQMQNWQRILGLTCIIRVESVSETELAYYVSEGDYEIAFCPLTAASPDALSFLMHFTADSPDNCIFLQNENYKNLLAAANVASADTQQQYIKAAADYLVDYNYIVPVFAESAFLVQTSGVSGIYCYTNAERVYFTNAYSDN